MLNIMTLTWNGESKLAKLEASLMPALDGIDYKWFIKDNASKDDTLKLISDWANPNVVAHAYPNNQQNFSEGCNYLFERTSASDKDYVMLLNNDIVFNDTTSIKRMLSILDNDESVGMVGARLLYTDTDKLQHAGVVFNPTYKTPMHFRAGQQTDNASQQNRLFQVVTGAVCITRGEYFKNAYTKNKSGIKGMDEGYHWAFDDVDLCLSIKYNMDKKIVYCGNTGIFHEESASLKKNPVNKLYLPNNLKRLFEKWTGRYSIDQDIYTKNSNHNLYTGTR